MYTRKEVQQGTTRLVPDVHDVHADLQKPIMIKQNNLFLYKLK